MKISHFLQSRGYVLLCRYVVFFQVIVTAGMNFIMKLRWRQDAANMFPNVASPKKLGDDLNASIQEKEIEVAL